MSLLECHKSALIRPMSCPFETDTESDPPGEGGGQESDPPGVGGRVSRQRRSD